MRHPSQVEALRIFDSPQHSLLPLSVCINIHKGAVEMQVLHEVRRKTETPKNSPNDHQNLPVLRKGKELSLRYSKLSASSNKGNERAEPAHSHSRATGREELRFQSERD